MAKIDNLGNLQGTNDVSAFGELISNTAPDLLLFTQHERDAENDSDETLYRQYASAQGRWLSPDPSNGSYDLTDPQSLNRYAYLSGRPLSGVDRFGLQDDDPSPGNDGDGIGGVISTIFVAAIDFFSNFFGGNSVNPALAHSTVNTSIESSYNPNVPTFYVNSYAGVGAGESFGVFPAAYTFYVTAAASGGAPSNLPGMIKCTGVGRGLAGNTRLVGRQGGIPGQTVQLNTAAVTPTQFNVPNGAALSPFAPYIHGTVGGASFNSVTDVNGGKSPIPGVPVRTALQQLFPGQLILEIPGAKDQGANAPVTIYVPQSLGCPAGTHG